MLNNYFFFVFCIIFSILYAMIAEYFAHRWLMHVGIFGKNEIWRAHTIEHHKNHRNDVNIELPPWHSFILGLPLLLFCFFLGWPWLVTVIILAFLHATTWSCLHSAFHNVGHQWIKSWWYYKQWERHHLLHHVHWNKNYGAVFIWTDYLFGTKI